MRLALRHLPAFLFLLVPLVLLAVLGSAELSRQEQRADRALREQALLFLDDAARTFESRVRRRADALAEEGLDLSERSLVLAAARLTDPSRDPRVSNLLVLDPDGDLLFPIPSPPLQASLAFHDLVPARGRAILQAEWLAAAGDMEGAELALEEFLMDPSGLGHNNTPAAQRTLGLALRMRAAFELGTLLRRAGRDSSAQSAYREATDYADLLLSLGSTGERGRNTAAAAKLLSSVADAELTDHHAGGHGAVLDVILNITEGDHDGVADEMLATVLQRLVAEIPGSSQEHPAVSDAMEIEATRRAGRLFAREYRDAIADTVKRRLQVAKNQGTLFQAYTSPDACSLLVIRRVTATEREDMVESDPAWVGLRLDLTALVRKILGPFLQEGTQGFSLDILDPDGLPVLLDRPAEPDQGNVDHPTRSTLAGLQLIARPADTQAIVHDQQTSLRMRALLLVVLCLSAGGGAFFLLRSVSREAELAALKVGLVSRVSHELKTPLALIKMYGETIGLGRTRDARQTTHFASIISREADRLTALINRILDFSGRQAGTITYEPKTVDLSSLLHTVTEEYRPHMEASHTPFETSIQPGVTVEVDPEAMEGAVLNLLDNAIKYTPADATDRTIELCLEAADSSAILEVRDRGVGIPAKELGQIYESFFRASTAGEIRGAGLGLSLVQHFAKAHGGSVSASPRPQGGTTFRLALPTPDGRLHVTNRPASDSDSASSPKGKPEHG